MKVLILAPFEDLQTGLYIMDSFKELASDVVGIDTRRIIEEVGPEKSQEILLEEITSMDIEPDIVLVLKGIELAVDTVDKIKNKFPKAKLINWMFDKYVGGIEVWKNSMYLQLVKKFDYYFCSLKGVANILKNMGFRNVYWLPEGYHPNYTGIVYVNHYQKQKYGEDISFVGTLGLTKYHKNRIPFLQRVVREGFRVKIWGNIGGDWKSIPQELKEVHVRETAVNDRHSKVAICSLINLGIDQDIDLELGQSARMYRVMGAGGFYLTTYVPKLEQMFKINKDGAQITDDLELVVYYSIDDLINKLDWLLEHDEVREKIAKNGHKAVVENHTFLHRCKDMVDKIKKGEKNVRTDIQEEKDPEVRFFRYTE